MVKKAGMNLVGREKQHTPISEVEEKAFVGIYDNVFAKIRSELGSAGVKFTDPKMIINDKKLDYSDYFYREGPLPYYYVQRIDNRMYYHVNHPGFYDYDRNAIVLDWTRIHSRLEAHKRSDFGRVNGVTEKEAEKYISSQIDSTMRRCIPIYLQNQKKFSKGIDKLVSDSIGIGLIRSVRDMDGGDKVAKGVLEHINGGIGRASEYVVASFLLKKGLKAAIADGEAPHDYLSHQSGIVEGYDSRFGFLKNFYLGEVKHERKQWEGYNHEEHLAATLSDYVNFSRYPYYLTNEGVGVLFASVLLKEKDAVAIATDAERIIRRIDSITKAEFRKYNLFDYYTPRELGGGTVYVD